MHAYRASVIRVMRARIIACLNRAGVLHRAGVIHRAGAIDQPRHVRVGRAGVIDRSCRGLSVRGGIDQ